MYKQKIKFLLVVGLIVASFLTAHSQTSKSPFTSRGIGDINNLTLSHNQSMGGVSLSNGSYWYLNNVNPALLPYNTLTVFAAGLTLEQRKVSNDATSETNSGGSLSYLAMAFPVKPGKWTTSVGLAPYSNVDYSFTILDVPVTYSDTVTTNITESGSGGFSQLYWSNGVALNKNLSVGLKATYIFSAIETEFLNTLQQTNDPVLLEPAVKNRTSVSDFLFQGSVAYNRDSIFNNKIRLNVGATYDFGGKVDASVLESTELQQSGRPLITDTLSNQENGNIDLPWAVGVGFSFSNRSKWTAGMDFRYQPWSEFRNFLGSNEDLDDSYSIAIGGEITPDPSSVTSYIKRVTYRLGFTYENTPYVINGEQIKDFGINFGWSLPVSRFSSLDMAFKYGKRGKTSDTTIEEDYFRFTLGITFNDQWFIKRKYD